MATSAPPNASEPLWQTGGTGGGGDGESREAAQYELELPTRRLPCDLHLGPLYDPKMERVKA